MQSEIGAILKEARRAKQLSLEDVSRTTRISPRILENIESGAFDKLPGRVYTRSFIKQYAEFLGIETPSVLQEFRTGKNEKGDAFRDRPEPERRIRRLFSNSFLPALAGIILLAVAGWRGMSGLSEKIHQLKQNEGDAFAIGMRGEVPEFLIPENVPLEVTLRAAEPTWIQVRVDGEIAFQNVLAKESFEVWHPKKEAELWIGNAGGIEVFLNNRFLGKPGKRGQVMKGIVLSRKGMRAP